MKFSVRCSFLGGILEYRRLGRTGVKVGELCPGCMMFGGRAGGEDS